MHRALPRDDTRCATAPVEIDPQHVKGPCIVDRRFSRRSLVQGIAAGTAATTVGSRALARQATPATTSGSEFDVIVVGAGAAGLGAGQKLAQLGLPAVVLEARDRIGGRCYCDNAFPVPFDFGGQFFQQVVPNAFGGTNNPLYDLYIAQGGQDQPVVLLPDFYENGVRMPAAEQAPFHDMATAIGAELAVAGIAAQLGAPDQSVAELTSDLAGQPWYTLTTAFLALAFDAPVSRLSVLDVWNDLQFALNPDGSPSDKVNPAGMGNFIAQFAAGHVDLGDAGRKPGVQTGADRVKVVTDQGPVSARAVIVTAPVTVLAAGDIAFRPALPTAYTQAFDDLPFGVVDKIGIAFTSDVFAGAAPNTMVTQHLDTERIGLGLAKMAGAPMMNLIVAEDLARDLEAGGAAAVGAYAREFVTDTFGAAAASAIDRTITHGWGTDPLTLGSYSAARVGKVGARATLATPLDNRLYFAGEAISTYAHSSLHGAYLTGQGAATSISDHHGAHP
jgi:monoamine oxidase